MNQDEVFEKRSILGYNLYAYCQNNPIMHMDSTGKSVAVLVGTIFVVAKTAIDYFLIIAAAVSLGIMIGVGVAELVKTISLTYEAEAEKTEVFFSG